MFSTVPVTGKVCCGVGVGVEEVEVVVVVVVVVVQLALEIQLSAQGEESGEQYWTTQAELTQVLC